MFGYNNNQIIRGQEFERQQGWGYMCVSTGSKGERSTI